MPEGNDYVAISAGFEHGLALKIDGSIIGWGSNLQGQIAIPPGNDFVAVAAGFMHSLGLKADGQILGWGANNFGQIDVPAGTGFVAITTGGKHGLTLLECTPGDINDDGLIDGRDLVLFTGLIADAGGTPVQICAGDLGDVPDEAIGVSDIPNFVDCILSAGCP